jgi:hypothetical protein
VPSSNTGTGYDGMSDTGSMNDRADTADTGDTAVNPTRVMVPAVGSGAGAAGGGGS